MFDEFFDLRPEFFTSHLIAAESVFAQLHGDAAIGEVDGVGGAAEDAHLDIVDDIREYHFPVVDLEEDTAFCREAGLAGLRAIPLDAVFKRDGDRADDHLRRAGQHIGAVGHVGDGRFRRLRHVAEGLDVNDVNGDIRVHRFRARQEAIDIELRVANFDGPDHADHATHGLLSGDGAVDIATLLGSGGVGVDVIQPEGIVICAPGEGNFWEFRRQIGEDGTELRTMGDDEVKFAREGPIAQGNGGVIDDESTFLEDELEIAFAHLFLDSQQCVVHALAEGEVVSGAGGDGGHAERVVLRQRCRQRYGEDRDDCQDT